ncbi:sulfate reduction electron transfer complex DsrMKJOP subunit DsrJ [Chloroflexota bacterium]
MSDVAKIIIGLVIFICLITIPIWYALASRSAASVPELEIVTGEERCVESVPYMRTKHMELINDWRQSAVRESDGTYISSYGVEYDMSLTETCLDCHANKAEFCDRCHDYTGAKPNCWECHIVPEGD